MKHRVLLVDDDPDFLLQHRLLLERAGYDVHAAKSEAEALGMLETEQFDAAVLDLMLEHEDGGFILAHHIRRHSSMPIIIVSAVTSETGLVFGPEGAGESGWVKADAILPKPIRFEQLTRELERLLQG